MPLIIETYFYPYRKIADVLFPEVEFQFLEYPISEQVGDELFYYTRTELARDIKYYFNKIYFMADEKIVCIHKQARQIKYYDKDTGKLINFNLKVEMDEKLDKSDFLPQLKAQEGELVLFPESDDEI